LGSRLLSVLRDIACNIGRVSGDNGSLLVSCGGIIRHVSELTLECVHVEKLFKFENLGTGAGVKDTVVSILSSFDIISVNDVVVSEVGGVADSDVFRQV